MTRPGRVVVVLGTGTEVGKTWVACRLLEALRESGASVAARKPAQSFAAADLDHGEPTDAHLLAAATGEAPEEVCPPQRWYPVPMAPPMAADRLGQGPIHLDALLAELAWPGVPVDLGVIEAAGGVCSPIAHDGDGAALARRAAADTVVLVADAGLGTIHGVRSALAALDGLPTIVVLNRHDPADELHRANRRWLAERDGFEVVVDVPTLARALTSCPARQLGSTHGAA